MRISKGAIIPPALETLKNVTEPEAICATVARIFVFVFVFAQIAPTCTVVSVYSLGLCYL